MITLISSNGAGLNEWCVSTEEEMQSLDKNSMMASSTCKILDDEIRVFMLKADKSGWIEI